MDDEIRREAFSRYSFVNEVRKWEDMHTDCLVKIFEKVDIDSLIEYLPLVCKSWYKSTLDPQCWKILDFCYLDTKSSVRPPSQEFANYTSKVNCAKSKIKFAVNRSCGKASKVVFPSLFYDENILQYVLGGCAELKSLVLPYNYELSFYLQDDLKCIPTQIYKLKDLESLSLDGSCHVKEILTEIHTHCKKIVSLTVRDEISTEVASAIVTFVPNIKELVLSHCDLYREDLILILSGCRRLELLDVTHCKGFDAEDAEVVALASHIKIFRSLGSVAFKYYNFVTDGYHSDSDLGYVLAS